MPEAVQQSLPIDTPAAPQAPKAPAKVAPVKGRYELPAEIEPEPKVLPKAPTPDQNKAEEATAAEPEGDKPEPTPEEVEKRRESRRFERRIDKLHRAAAEAKARAELAEKRLSEMSQPKAAADDAAPKLEQFDYDPEKYAAAKAEYATKKAEKEWTEKQRTEATKKHQESLVSSWEEKAEKAADKYDDFEEVVGKLSPDNPFTQAIMEADAGLAYYLAKHPKEVERLSELPTVSARIRELGKLEAKLAAEPEKPKAPSKAPAPIKPLSGAGNVASDAPSEEDDMKTWMRKRNKQVHGRNK